MFFHININLTVVKCHVYIIYIVICVICVYIEMKQNIVNHHAYYVFNFITIPDNRIRCKSWKYSQHFINKSPLYR